MGADEEILELLRTSKGPVSGEEMARRLGITRNSVWKAVEKLRRTGYEIEAGTNKGYRLVRESQVLSPENIRLRLDKELSGLAIQVREVVSSTNTVLKELAEQGGREGMVIIAQRQEKGKGRLGRSFHSPRGAGLYMSILLRPALPAEESLAITTAAAVAVAGAIDTLTGERSKIKWVNDVYLHGKKVCGILTEASVDFENGGLHYAVLGIGVNLQAPPGGFPAELSMAGAIFPDQPPEGARAWLAAEILNRFFACYRQLPQRGFMEEYRARSLLTGMEITFQQGASQWDGTVQGIDDQARLLVRLPDGRERAFGAGEVAVMKKSLQNLQENGEET